jgi:hypothetical protein
MKELTYLFNDGCDGCCNQLMERMLKIMWEGMAGLLILAPVLGGQRINTFHGIKSALPATQTATASGNVCRNSWYEKYRSFRLLFHDGRHIPIELTTPRSQPESKTLGMLRQVSLGSQQTEKRHNKSSRTRLFKTQQRWRQCAYLSANPRGPEVGSIRP